jgi:hypothetical protein
MPNIKAVGRDSKNLLRIRAFSDAKHLREDSPQHKLEHEELLPNTTATSVVFAFFFGMYV